MATKHVIPTREIRKLLVAAGVVPSLKKGREWAELHGLAWDTVYRIMKGKRQHVPFRVADRIVCALGDPVGAWYGPLARWYYPPGQKPPPEFKMLVRGPKR